MNFSQDAKWKALISKYMSAIPLSGDASGMAEHNISCAPPPRIPVNAAINAKVRAAPSDSRSAARRAVSPSPRDTTLGMQRVLSVMIVGAF
jgi:hypothetical protein